MAGLLTSFRLFEGGGPFAFLGTTTVSRKSWFRSLFFLLCKAAAFVFELLIWLASAGICDNKNVRVFCVREFLAYYLFAVVFSVLSFRRGVNAKGEAYLRRSVSECQCLQASLQASLPRTIINNSNHFQQLQPLPTTPTKGCLRYAWLMMGGTHGGKFGTHLAWLLSSFDWTWWELIYS